MEDARQWDMSPEPTELLLIGYLIESIWTPKSKSNTLTPKTQLADILTKGNFTRDEWNHLLCLFNISHFSSTDCSEVLSKRRQKYSGEERVTAKSKPMMNLVSRCTERTPDVLSSTASESPEKTRHESQFPLSPQTEQHHRTGRPVEHAYSSSYSVWNVDKTWSSQEWKSDELMEVRTGRPVVTAQHADRFVVENDKMIFYTEAESEMSLETRSFLHRVNDQVRKRQNQSSKDAAKDSDKHSVIWRMFTSSTLQASVFMVKNYSDNLHSIENTEDLTMKQMFDISEKLVTEQSDEIFGISTIKWKHSSWKYLSLVGDEQVISLLHTKVYVFSDSVLCLGKVNENPKSNIAWEDRLTWFKSSPEYRALDKIDCEPMEFEWNIFPGFTTLQLCSKVQELLSRLSVEPEKFTGRIIFMSMFNDISWGYKDNRKECESNAQLVSLCAKRFGAGQWSFLGPGSEKKWYSTIEDSPQGEWYKIAEKMMLTFAGSGHPVFPATSPLSRGVLKSKGGGKMSIHYCPDPGTIETVFRTITFVNQLSLYGAVAEMCEESYHDRTGRHVVEGQSNPLFVPSVMKTQTFDRWFCTTRRRSIAKIRGTNWKVITTR